MSFHTDLDVFLKNFSNKNKNTQLTKKDYSCKDNQGKCLQNISKKTRY